MAAESKGRDSFLSTDNRLFNLARTGELRLPKSFSESTVRVIDRFLYPAAVIFFSFSWPFLALFFLIPLVILLVVFGLSSADLFDTVLNFSAVWLIPLYIPVYLFVWLWLWLFEKRHLWTVGFERNHALKKYIRGLLAGFLLFSGTLVILLAFDAVDFQQPESNKFGQGMLITGLLIFVGWMVQGGAEETVTRGFLLPILGVRYGTLAGIGVSSIIFTLLHLLNPGISVLALVNLILFSLFAALFALFEGGLWGIAALHGMWNWAQGSLFGLQVSGLESSSLSLFQFTSTGPDWLTGGDFGPEGGIAVTIIFIGAIGALILVRRRREERL
ncbi:MAG: type II CAAX endopeptidase family protein [Anaerolineae bacterium]|nr:MAG: type II CAAX endopeptidase family protein [Anaerolineae bacterium]